MSVSFAQRPVQRWALGIEYDGSAFHGFQRQGHEANTVQGALEAALSFVADEAIKIVCAGRTDTGVHATAQVVHFDTHASRSPNAWVRGGNSRCPDGVVVLWAQAVPSDFSARFSARQRRYTYVLGDGSTPSAIDRAFVTHTMERLDTSSMQLAAQVLVGEHDFSSFRAAGCQARSPVRRIATFTVRRYGACILFDVTANAFLQHMVRNLVGSLCLVGTGEITAARIAAILAQKDRRIAGPAAAAVGLYLTQVVYDADYGFPMSYRPPWFLVGSDGVLLDCAPSS